jgi:hypothetical protein
MNSPEQLSLGLGELPHRPHFERRQRRRQIRCERIKLLRRTSDAQFDQPDATWQACQILRDRQIHENLIVFGAARVHDACDRQ